MKEYIKRISWVRELVRAYRNCYIPKWGRIIKVAPTSRVVHDSNIKEILIATGGGGYAAAKQVESLISASLIARGARVEVLLCDGILPACFQTTIDWDSNEKKFASKGTSKLNCVTCYKAASITYSNIGVNVIKLSNLVSVESREELRVLSQEIQIEDLKKYSINDIQIGEHAVAGALRFYARAALSDEYSEVVLRRYFHAGLITAYACNNLFSRKSYHHVALHHGIYVPQGVISDAAIRHGIPTSTWHVAYRNQCLIFSHNGTYHKTLMSEPNTVWQNIDLGEEHKKLILDYLASRWHGSNDQISFSRSLNRKSAILLNDIFDDSKKNILLLTNVLWDAQLHYPNNAFRSMIDWIVFTIEYFKERQDLRLIIRVHPAEISGTLPSRQKVKDEIDRLFGVLPSSIVIVGPESSISTYDLANNCDCAIIYGTKAGVELTAMGIPTIVAGEAWIRGKGVSLDVSNPEEYLHALESLPLSNRLAMDVKERAIKYAYHFFFRRMIYLESIKPVLSHMVFKYDINSHSDLLPGKDPGLDVICNGILYGSSYVYDREPPNK